MVVDIAAAFDASFDGGLAIRGTVIETVTQAVQNLKRQVSRFDLSVDPDSGVQTVTIVLTPDEGSR
jgi:hypothetical protein